MTKVFGHRGAAGYALENSLESFTKAKEAKVDYIETDVWQTLDGELVIFHDLKLDRITDHKGLISKYNLDDIKKVKLNNGENILLLAQLCKFCQDFNLKLFIELKNDDTALKAKNVVETYLSHDKYILGSFFHSQIEQIKTRYPYIKTCLIFEGVLDKIENYLQSIKSDFISVGFESCNNYLVDSVKNSGKSLIFWTINDVTDCNEAMTYDPYGLVTNFPVEIKSAIEIFSNQREIHRCP